jgi:hypothetical protein
MSIYEAIMMFCFGIAWPFSIWKSWHSKENGSKSLSFMVIAFVGYVAGIIHKVLYNNDIVTYLYIINEVLICMDIAIYFRNAHLEKNADDFKVDVKD